MDLCAIIITVATAVLPLAAPRHAEPSRTASSHAATPESEPARTACSHVESPETASSQAANPQTASSQPASSHAGSPETVPSQRSGIEGRLYLVTGNRMPSPPRRPVDTTQHSSTLRHSASGPGVKGTICVYELTNDSQVTRRGTSPWCDAVHTRLIRQVETDDKGNFTIPLPPGTYSVFVKSANLFYASRRDEKNNIAPVEVLPGKMTRADCSVESGQKAVY